MTELTAGVSVRMLRPPVAGLVAAGVDPAPVLAGVKLSPAALLEHDSRVPHSVALALWQAATDATEDSCFGLHVAERLDLSLFDVQGHVTRASSDDSRSSTRGA